MTLCCPSTAMDAALPLSNDGCPCAVAPKLICARAGAALQERWLSEMVPKQASSPLAPRRNEHSSGDAPAKARRGPQTAKRTASQHRQKNAARAAGPPPMNRRCAVSTP